MRKSVIAVPGILLVVVGLVVSAEHFGRITEQTLRDRLANMPYGLQMELAEYRRGLFSSTARIEWNPLGSLSIAPMPDQDAFGDASATGLSTVFVALDSGPIVIDLEIAHGPVFYAVGPGAGLFNARGRIDLGGDAAEAELSDSPGNDIDIYASSFSGRTVSSRLEFGNIDWRIGPVSMNFAGGRMAGEWTGPSAFQLQYAAFEKMAVNTAMADAGIRFSLTDVESRTEYPQGVQSGVILAPAETNSSIGEVHVAGADGNTLIRMTGLSSLDTVSLGEDGLYSFASELEMQSLDVMGREFAPMELSQTGGGISEAAVMELVTALSSGIFEMPAAPQPREDVPQSPFEAPPLEAPGGALPQLTAEFADAIRALLRDGPYADLSAVAMYQGEQALKLDLRQAIHPDRAPEGADLASIPAILSSLEYTLDIEIPEAAAEEVLGDGLFLAGLAQGLLKQNERAYSLSVALQDGRLELNGRVLPLPLPAAAPAPPEAFGTSPFEGAAPFPLEEDEPSPFDQARRPQSD